MEEKINAHFKEDPCTEPVSSKVNKLVREALDDLYKKEKLNKSALIRFLLEDYVAKRGYAIK